MPAKKNKNKNGNNSDQGKGRLIRKSYTCYYKVLYCIVTHANSCCSLNKVSTKTTRVIVYKKYNKTVHSAIILSRKLKVNSKRYLAHGGNPVRAWLEVEQIPLFVSRWWGNETLSLR